MPNYFTATFTDNLWPEVTNVPNPPHFTDDFNEDRGYFCEDNGKHEWQIKDGMLTTSHPEGITSTYLHIFEKNVTVKARIRVRDLNPPDSIFGILLRHNADEAFVRCGCFVKSGSWFIDSRRTKDFPCERLTRVIRPMEENRWYDIEFTVDGDRAVLKVDGEVFADVRGVSHNSHGRVGFYAHRLSMDVDSVDAAFLSGNGTLIANVNHTKLPVDKYMEGGSVWEMTDGKLIYEHHSGTTFESANSGESWELCDTPWTNTHGYPNILRLRNGKFIKMISEGPSSDRNILCELSDDDGKTWTKGGIVCHSPYHGTTHAYAGNMNDKLTQISNGRIFYCLNYECHPRIPVDGHAVFCEFYYSDDNGDTWTKSETDSWDLGGKNANNVEMFGECKILECADGTLRMYNSWNDYPCVMYSESTDGGVTWGALREMPELVCARSSMQFWRDPYADNETTYYMALVYSPVLRDRMPTDSEPNIANTMGRSRLALLRSTDGKSWHFLCDVWRWESPLMSIGTNICHVVDAFIMTTKDYVIVGAGFSEHLDSGDPAISDYHHAQRQHIYSIPKAELSNKPMPRV